MRPVSLAPKNRLRLPGRRRKKLFLDEVLRTRRKDTHRDYKIKLGAAELTQRFTSRLVSQITDVEAATAYAEIFKRAEPMGDGCLRVMKRFWNWMGDASRVSITGVTINLDKVQPLPRTLSEDGDPNRQFDPKRDLKKKSPPEIELGRALAIARSGALPDWASYGLQLLLASAQRRRQVIGASRFRFKDYEETPNEVAWFIPAFWRKTRKEGTERAHLVPVMGWGAEAVRKLDRLCDFEGSAGWLFPALKGNGEATLYPIALPWKARSTFETNERSPADAHAASRLRRKLVCEIRSTIVTAAAPSQLMELGRG